MAEIPIDEFRGWLDAYGAAWQDGDAQAAIDLFTDDAEYYENPFEDPLVGKSAIRRYWSEGAGESQSDVVFLHEAMAVVERKGLAQWQATFVRIPSGNHVELNGFLIAEFDGAGKCSVFREWWHRREEDSVEAA
jgi:hypothetical protein